MAKGKSTKSRKGDPALKQLRRDASRLKKRGILPASLDVKKMDNTARNRAKVAKFAGVLTGDDKVYKVSKSEARKLRAAGQTVVNDKLILRAEPGTRRDYKAGKIHTKPLEKEGFERIEFPVPYRNLAQWLRTARNDPALENLKRPGDRWAFRYFGNNSYDTYADLDAMLADLERYESTEEAIDDGDEEGMREVYRNVELFRVQRGKWPRHYKARARKRETAAKMKARRPKAYKRTRERDRLRKQAARDKIKSNPKKHAAFKAKDAARKRRERARKKRK